jgi:LysR family transcriptional regulator, glycine cleavage system transcriptional activator
MSRLPVHLGALEIFAEAGRLGSFKQAAESLSISTSAVSQAIRKLENRLNRDLFSRNANRVELTAEGRKLLTHVEAGIERMRTGLSELVLEQGAPVSISSPPGIASQLLSPVITSLLDSEFSDIRFTTDEKPDFASYRSFDVAIVHGEEGAQKPDLEFLGPDVFMPVCRRSIASKVKSVSDLHRFPLLTNEGSGVSWDDWLNFNRLSIRDAKWLRFNRSVPAISAMLEGMGIGLESLRLITPYVKRGDLVLCDLPGCRPLSRALTHLYVTKTKDRRDRAEAVAQLIRERCFTGADGFLGSL